MKLSYVRGIVPCCDKWRNSLAKCSSFRPSKAAEDFLLLPAQIFSLYIRRIRSQSRVDFDSIFYRRICCFTNEFVFLLHSVVAWIFSAACLKKASILSLIGALNESHRARLVGKLFEILFVDFSSFHSSYRVWFFLEFIKWNSSDFRGFKYTSALNI